MTDLFFALADECLIGRYHVAIRRVRCVCIVVGADTQAATAARVTAAYTAHAA